MIQEGHHYQEEQKEVVNKGYYIKTDKVALEKVENDDDGADYFQ